MALKQRHKTWWNDEGGRGYFHDFWLAFFSREINVKWLFFSRESWFPYYPWSIILQNYFLWYKKFMFNLSWTVIFIESELPISFFVNYEKTIIFISCET